MGLDFGIGLLFKPKSRRWFSIQKNQLVYQKKFKVSVQKLLMAVGFHILLYTAQQPWVCVVHFVWVYVCVCVCLSLLLQDQPTVVVEDLRLCTVKPSSDERRFCFEVVSPSK